MEVLHDGRVLQESEDGKFVLRTIPRSRLWEIQTPQVSSEALLGKCCRAQVVMLMMIVVGGHWRCAQVIRPKLLKEAFDNVKANGCACVSLLGCDCIVMGSLT